MIEINQSSAIPIYQQVYEELVKLIVLKVLKEEDKLPSVRELALMININPNTIQKAYKQMEEEGFIFSLKGKGNYISKYEDIIMIYKKSLNQQLSSLVDEYLAIGETESSVRELVSILVQERHNDSSR